jgi:arylsulfatase A-like enzyme
MGEWGAYFNHGWSVTLDLLRVPLIIKPPGKPASRRVSTHVSLIDLMPTLLEAVGAESPQGLLGHSLLSLLRGKRPEEAGFVFSEIGSQYSLIDDRYQVLAGYDGPTFTEEGLKQLTIEFNSIPLSLFAYREDPRGEKDLMGSERAAAEACFGRLRAFLQTRLTRVKQIARVKRPPVQDSAETRAILKQLGY